MVPELLAFTIFDHEMIAIFVRVENWLILWYFLKNWAMRPVVFQLESSIRFDMYFFQPRSTISLVEEGHFHIKPVVNR